MPIEIIVPRLGWSMEEGAFVAWLKKDGEFVRAGEPLFSIEGDKALQEIESIDSGVLRILAHGPKSGDAIRVGDVLGHLVAVDEPNQEAGPATSPKTDAGPRPRQAPLVSTATTITTPIPTLNISRPKRYLAISPRALRTAQELGVDWTTVTGSGRTGRIRERDIRAAASSRSFS
jgi:pyruvate dehydrogenase E2 component (dihydrolipoamide acetyltransferase)